MDIDTGSLRITHKWTVFDVYVSRPLDVFRVYDIDDRYVVFTASTTLTRLGFLLSNGIAAGLTDLVENKSRIVYNATVDGFLVGKYMNYVLILANNSYLIAVDPETGYLSTQKLGLQEYTYRAPGDVILYHDPKGKQYFLLMLPILYDKYLLAVMSEKELQPLPEPPLGAVILLAALLTTIILTGKRKH